MHATFPLHMQMLHHEDHQVKRCLIEGSLKEKILFFRFNFSGDFKFSIWPMPPFKKNALRSSRTASSEEEEEYYNGTEILINKTINFPSAGVFSKFRPLFAKSVSSSAALIEASSSDENEELNISEGPYERTSSTSTGMNFEDANLGLMRVLNKEDAEFLSLYTEEALIKDPHLPYRSEDEDDLLLEDQMDKFASGDYVPQDKPSSLFMEDDLDEEVERWESTQALYGQGTGLYGASGMNVSTHLPIALKSTSISRTMDEGADVCHFTRQTADPNVNKMRRSLAHISIPIIDAEENEKVLEKTCAFSDRTLTRLRDQLHSLNSRLVDVGKRVDELRGASVTTKISTMEG